jgi:hypothetical protein
MNKSQYVRHELPDGSIAYGLATEPVQTPKRKPTAMFYNVMAILGIGGLLSLGFATVGDKANSYLDFELREVDRLTQFQESISPYASKYCNARLEDIEEKIKMNDSLGISNNEVLETKKELESNCLNSSLKALGFL